MSTSTTSSSTTTSPLQAAQKIVADLEGMTNEHRLLAVKFAMETLGLQLAASPAPLAPAHTHSTYAAPPANESTSAQRTDIRSFTAAKAPKSDQQFAAVVAYFFQFEAPPGDRKNSIDAATMKEAARQVGRKQVRDWSVTLNNALRSGYLDKGERGAFRLNSVGENLVAITLPGNAATGTVNGGNSKKKSAKKKSASKKAKNG
jgi:hypothetical protein